VARNGKQRTPKTCLCGCGGELYSRGLASACYHAARRHVAAGTTTWEALVSEGLALEPFEQNERRNPFTRRLKSLSPQSA
jgi:hypothetical protein